MTMDVFLNGYGIVTVIAIGLMVLFGK